MLTTKHCPKMPTHTNVIVLIHCRTHKCKALAAVGLTITLLGYLLILLRWPIGPNHWELVYPFLTGLGYAGLLSAQFAALSTATPEGQSATTITVYYQCQQIGIILGVALSAAVCRRAFECNLLNSLGTDAKTREVSLVFLYFTSVMRISLSADTAH
jgi:MFS family permease